MIYNNWFDDFEVELKYHHTFVHVMSGLQI